MGPNPQVIHNVDKKVSYQGGVLPEMAPERFKRA